MEVGSKDVGREQVEGVELSAQLTATSAIRQRAEAATPGPWVYEKYWNTAEDGRHILQADDRNVFITCHGFAATNKVEDGDFIAHAREDIPYLLDRLEAAEREATDFRLISQTIAAERDDWYRLAQERIKLHSDTLGKLHAAHQALETARRALKAELGPEGYGYCPWCRHIPGHCRPTCKRQQALTDIAAMLDGEKA